MENKVYEQMRETIRGTEYVFQKVPVRSALRMRMAWTRPDQSTDDIIMAEQLLKHVVVSPKKTLDDFDSLMELEQVANRALLFAFYDQGPAKDIEDPKNA